MILPTRFSALQNEPQNALRASTLLSGVGERMGMWTFVSRFTPRGEQGGSPLGGETLQGLRTC